MKKLWRFMKFCFQQYKPYKEIGIKHKEAFEWYERFFRARDVVKWKEKKVTYEEAWWGRLFGVTPETWKPLGHRKIGIAMVWPIAPDGVEHYYEGLKTQQFGTPTITQNSRDVRDIKVLFDVFDADIDVPAQEE